MSENTDYLKNARDRSMVDDSKVSEAELHADNEGIRNSWLAIQEVKGRMAVAKQEAIAKVNEQFKEELEGAMADYAMLVSLGR